MTITQRELWALISAGEVRRVAEAIRADPTLVAVRSADHDMPLHHACWQKQLAIVGLLLGYAPDVNVRGDGGHTPLHYAVYEGRSISVPIVGALIGAGADPTMCDDEGIGVEDWAKLSMAEGLPEVLDMIDHWRRRHP